MDFLKNIFTRIRNWITGIWEKTERRDRMRFLVISVIALTLIIAAFVMLGSGSYVELSTNMDAEAIAAAQSVLDENAIGYRMDGEKLLVHKDDQTEAVSVLTLSGRLPYEPNYSIYQMGSGLSGTEDDRNMYANLMKEDQIRQTLERFDFVESAAVILNTANNTNAIFISEMEISTASVQLLLSETELERSQIDAMVDHVATAAGIEPENVTITDQTGRKLNKLAISDESDLLQRRDSYKKQFEGDLAYSLSRLLDPIFGSENVSITPNAVFNYDETTIQKTEFAPVVDEDGIARSVQTLVEDAIGNAPYGGEPGTDEDGLGEDYAEVDDMVSEYHQTQETINYEINQTLTEIRPEMGALENIMLSAAINSNVITEDEQNTEAIMMLIGAAAGIPPEEQESRIAVQYHPFRGLVQEEQDRAEYEAWLRRQELFELIKLLALYLIIGVCVIILIWRTFAFLKPKPVEVPEEEPFMLGDMEDYGELLEAAEANQELEVTKTPSRERVEQFVESNPEAVASMLRTWLQDEGERGW
ncbi:MAG: hypothetical protein LBR76_01580 [Oscillospiraceae bacterium]|nr:hypothetical protein [Oscillospiraceae bacterium]